MNRYTFAVDNIRGSWVQYSEVQPIIAQRDALQAQVIILTAQLNKLKSAVTGTGATKE